MFVLAHFILFFYSKSLLSCVAFGYGCEKFSKYEEQGIGIQWRNIGQSPEEGDRYTFIVSIIMMLFDAFLYWVLTWYIENVFPGKPIWTEWWSPFMKSCILYTVYILYYIRYSMFSQHKKTFLKLVSTHPTSRNSEMISENVEVLSARTVSRIIKKVVVFVPVSSCLWLLYLVCAFFYSSYCLTDWWRLHPKQML